MSEVAGGWRRVGSRAGIPRRLVRLLAVALAALVLAPAGPAAHRVGGAAPLPPARQAAPTPPPTGEAISVILVERNDSGVVGLATLTASGEQTIVVVAIESPLGGGLPSHLHQGPCDEVNPVPDYPLADLFPGTPTTTVVDAPLSEFVAGGFAIAVHRPFTDLTSALDPSSIVACGEVGPSVGGVTTEMPEFGVGSSYRAAGQSPLSALLGGLALLLATGGLALRRRADRV